MTPEEVCKKLNGQTSLNRMKAVVNGKLEIIARLKGDKYEFTPVGAAKAAEFNAEKAVGLSSSEEVEKPKRRTRKVVESSDFDVELPDN